LKNPTNRAQRGFVVEYKSSRRQPKEAAKSIWGNTDLRAISRAVADDMEVPLAPVPRKESPTVLDPSQVPAQDRLRDTFPAAFPVPERLDATQASEAVSEPVIALTVSETIPKANVKRKPRRQKPVNSVHSKQATPDNEAQTAVSVDHFDELAALELDNRHLKKLLVEKLRIENRQLARMLERFAT